MGAELDVGALAVGVGSGRLAVHARQALLRCPIHQEALGLGEEVLPPRRRHRHRLARVPDGVTCRAQAHSLVAEQLPVLGLGHAGDVGARRQPRRDLGGVVDPAHVIAVPVGSLDRLAQHPTLVGLEEAERASMLLPDSLMVSIFGRLPA